MTQCRGSTKRGRRCRRTARTGSHYCRDHEPSQFAWLPPVVGAAAGVLFAPTLAGASAGAAIGFAYKVLAEEEYVSKPRLFISFDYDHDSVIKDFLVGQSRNNDSPFEIADWSIKEAVQGDWKAEARRRIRRSDQVIVICGNHTDTATGVNTELRIAQEEGKPYFLLNGYRNSTTIKPRTAKAGDKIYKWTWDNLKALVGGAR